MVHQGGPSLLLVKSLLLPEWARQVVKTMSKLMFKYVSPSFFVFALTIASRVGYSPSNSGVGNNFHTTSWICFTLATINRAQLPQRGGQDGFNPAYYCCKVVESRSLFA